MAGVGRQAPVGRDQHEAPFPRQRSRSWIPLRRLAGRATPWNKGKLLGQKPPLKLKEIWAIRIRLQLDHRARELALFNLAIDSKLRGCDLVGLRVHDVVQGSHVAPARNRHAEEDAAAGAIRDHRTNARRGRRLDRGGASEAGPVPLSEPRVGVAGLGGRLGSIRRPMAPIRCGAPNRR